MEEKRNLLNRLELFYSDRKISYELIKMAEPTKLDIQLLGRKGIAAYEEGMIEHGKFLSIFRAYSQP